jgi:hypothetical protein
VPLIGFSGSPWTLACYMIEGGGSDNFSKIKAMMLREPQLLHRLLEVVSESVIAYLSRSGRPARRRCRYSTPGWACSRRTTTASSRCATCSASPQACSAAKARRARR